MPSTSKSNLTNHHRKQMALPCLRPTANRHQRSSLQNSTRHSYQSPPNAGDQTQVRHPTSPLLRVFQTNKLTQNPQHHSSRSLSPRADPRDDLPPRRQTQPILIPNHIHVLHRPLSPQSIRSRRAPPAFKRTAVRWSAVQRNGRNTLAALLVDGPSGARARPEERRRMESLDGCWFAGFDLQGTYLNDNV